ncbi:adenylate/guanylate cyclase domain-containing protein [Mesoterricola silvestris]|uniref:Adenylate cyclase n=1 Tax=Mesoterricola silvestris TaxID=2927979 RepID=A0AA48GJL1_9BACT|nr:adenylate/guanylate cyclase domain-containing protein [Mesoterricola silvestris]BDU70919.1 adenylate cyclase [Mesoterricola silvestris]
MKIILLVEGARRTVELTEEGITVGRGDAATVKITSNAVSRVHARFFLKGGQVHVQDMKSMNGTTYRDAPVLEPTPLHPGDTILLGEVPIQWVREETAAAPQPAPPKAHTEARIALEDRAFDTSGSIMVPHATLEDLLARHQADKAPAEVEALFSRLASMAGKLLAAAGLAELLESVMSLVSAQIPCQRGFILLADPSGDLVPEFVWEERPGAITTPISRTIARTAMTAKVTILTTDARVDPRFSAGESIKIHGISSALCAPLIVDTQSLGVIYLESSLNKGGFKREDEHLLSAMANFAAVGIQRERETRFRQRLERYHSPQVVNEILHAAQNLDAPILQARRCEISVLFADISGFTRMSEGMEPLQLASILNRSFEVMTEQIFIRGGTLDKYIGDAIMAFFGAPAPDPDHAAHAVEAARAMQQGLKALNADRPAGYPELKMRIGINSGEAFAGDIGCEKRMDYTVMGSTVNLASRLESAVAGPGQIAIGPRTAEILQSKEFIPLQPVSLKNIELEVRPFLVPWE